MNAKREDWDIKMESSISPQVTSAVEKCADLTLLNDKVNISCDDTN
jgi:hypothetical protein